LVIGRLPWFTVISCRLVVIECRPSSVFRPRSAVCRLPSAVQLTNRAAVSLAYSCHDSRPISAGRRDTTLTIAENPAVQVVTFEDAGLTPTDRQLAFRAKWLATRQQ
jgi:hypothetical protein